MFFINFIKRRFYHVTPARSSNQLKKDFIDFPPNPLRGEAPTTQFEIVRVRGVGRNYQKIIELKEIYREIVDNQERYSVSAAPTTPLTLLA